MTKTKYYYDKNGKRISKVEGLRREKISKTLKKRNEVKKRETLKRNNARIVARTSSKPSKRPKKSTRIVRRKTEKLTFTVKRKRAKVKSFPNKKDKTTFFFSDKRYYELDTPLIIENETEARNIKEHIVDVKEAMYEDIKSIKNVKNRLVNIGYDISITFKSKDGKSKTDIDKVCYTPSVVITNKSDFNSAVNLLQSEIGERFVKYFSKNGFGGEIGIRGFETEISNEGIF